MQVTVARRMVATKFLYMKISVKAKKQQGLLNFRLNCDVITTACAIGVSCMRRAGLREVNFRFGFDDEEGVGVGVAGVAEFLAGFVEGVG